jgi:formiminotetrahydrofolate cyclodeaminase
LDLRSPSVADLLDRIAGGPPPPGGGAAAGLVAAMSAAVLTMAARSAEEIATAAQAEALRARLTELAEEDAAAYGHALASLRGDGVPESQQGRDFWLGRALTRAADAAVLIAEAAADVTELAADLAARVEGPHKPDAVTAAILAEAASRAAAHLVEVNLAASEGDERVSRARTAATAAAARASAVA